MKRTTLFLSCIAGLFAAHAQVMTIKQPNLTSFGSDKKVITKTLDKNSSESAKQHPEYGILPFNSQCSECVELIDKRTIDSRSFVLPNNNHEIFSQKSYFPLHYAKSETDIWRTIDFRLRPDKNNANVYVAENQPVPTKCDLNRQSTSITEHGFEFEFNKELTLSYFDENTVYSQPEKGDYSHYTVGEEGLEVKNMWGGIDMHQVFSAGEIKTSFIIHAPLQLPVTKGYLVIEDHFTLPEGFTVAESPEGKYVDSYYQGDYEVKDASGKVSITYQKPVYYDAKLWGAHGAYNLLKRGNEYSLQTLVPVKWLNQPDNKYPLVIDPIVTTSGITKMGDFRLSGTSANMGFTTKPAYCNYNMIVIVPGKSELKNVYVDLEYQTTYDNQCGAPTPNPDPFCWVSQVKQRVICDPCNVPVGLQCVQNPADTIDIQTCTTDPNLVPGAGRIQLNNTFPTFMNCIPPQCPDFHIPFTLQNQDSICGDLCGWLCARGNMWQMTVEACLVQGTITPQSVQVCVGQPAVFTAHPFCGVPPYHYAWSKDGGITYDTIYNSPNFIVIPQQAGTIFVRASILDSCNNDFVDPNDYIITAIASPSADAGPDVPLCQGGTATLGGNPTTNGNSAQWSGENAQVQNWLNSTTIYNPTLTVPTGTLDTFFYVVTASNPGCTRTDTVYVFSSPGPFANAGPDVTACAGSTVTLGGNPTTNAATVQWVGETASVTNWLNSATAANPQANIPQGTTGSVSFIVTGSTASCFNKDTVVVTATPAPVVDAGVDVSLCDGGTITLGGNPTAVGGTSILWTGNNATADSWLNNNAIANPQATIPAGTSGNFFYVVNVDDPLCPQKDSVNVVVHPNPVAIADTSGPTRICPNQTVTISVNGNYSSYQWSNGTSARSITVSQAGQFFVVVTDAFGCKDTSNIITVTTVPVPSVQVFPDTIITYGDSVVMYTDINLSSASIDSFNWYPTVNISCPTCTNPVVTPQAAAQYYGVNVYSGGCSATDSALIRVIFPNNFFIPNAFTPNGDGNNDEFYIKAQGGVSVLTFQVFNRWGEKIHDDLYPWDGTYKGKPVPPGVYVYIFKLGLFGDEQSLFRKGSVTLIR